MSALQSSLPIGLRAALVCGALASVAACGESVQPPSEPILIIGSSTVYPFAQQVAADYVAAHDGALPPVINSIGTGEGFEEFCAGEGPATADIVNASRRITLAEFNTCAQNGVTEVIEIKVGRDGIVFVSSTNDGITLSLTPEIIYRALAANPFGEEQEAANWSDLDRRLPNEPILVYGPPATSGTRDALLEIIMTPACREAADMAALEQSDPAAFASACATLREDAAYLEQGEQDDLVARKVANNPSAIGVLGFSYLEENAESLKGMTLGGVAPTADTIARGDYPGSRGLYIYVKKAHLELTPGLADYLAEWPQAWGSEGRLAQIGLVPMAVEAQARNEAVIANATAMTAQGLE